MVGVPSCPAQVLVDEDARGRLVDLDAAGALRAAHRQAIEILGRRGLGLCLRRFQLVLGPPQRGFRFGCVTLPECALLGLGLCLLGKPRRLVGRLACRKTGSGLGIRALFDRLAQLLKFSPQRRRRVGRRRRGNKRAGAELRHARIGLVEPDGDGAGDFQASQSIRRRALVLVGGSVPGAFQMIEEIGDLARQKIPHLEEAQGLVEARRTFAQ